MHARNWLGGVANETLGSSPTPTTGREAGDSRGDLLGIDAHFCSERAIGPSSSEKRMYTRYKTDVERNTFDEAESRLICRVNYNQ